MLFTTGGKTDFMWSFMWYQNKMPHKAAASPATPQGILLIVLYIKSGTVWKMTHNHTGPPDVSLPTWWCSALKKIVQLSVLITLELRIDLCKNLSPLRLLINITAVNVADSFLSLDTNISSYHPPGYHCQEKKKTLWTNCIMYWYCTWNKEANWPPVFLRWESVWGPGQEISKKALAWSIPPRKPSVFKPPLRNMIVISISTTSTASCPI